VEGEPVASMSLRQVSMQMAGNREYG